MRAAERFSADIRPRKLYEAGRTAELRALLLDLARVRWRLREFSVADLDTDLGLLAEDQTVRELRSCIRQWAHLLGPLMPADALKSTIMSRLPTGPARTALLRSAGSGSGFWLMPAWPTSHSSAPTNQVYAVGAPVTLLRAFPGAHRMLVGHAFEGKPASPPGGTDLLVLATDPLRLVGTLTGHRGGVVDAEVSPRGHEVLVSDRSGGLTLWTTDPDSAVPGTPCSLSSPHETAITKISFGYAGDSFATASNDGQVWLWDLPGRRPIRQLCAALPDQLGGRVVGLLVDTASRWVMRSYADAFEPPTTDVWSLPEGRRLPSVPGPLPVRTADGMLRAVKADLSHWDPVSGRTHPQTRSWLQVGSPNGRRRGRAGELVEHEGREWVSRWAVTSSPPAHIRVVSVEQSLRESSRSASRLEVAIGTSAATVGVDMLGQVDAAATDPAGRWYAVGTTVTYNRGEVFLCEPGRPDPIIRLGVHNAPITAMTALAEGTLLATGDRFGSVRIWSTQHADGPAVASDTEFAAAACVSTPSGGSLLVTDSGRTVHVLSRQDGRAQFTVKSRENFSFLNGTTYTCLLTSDSRYLVTADDDGTLYVTNAGTGVRTWTLRGHQAQVIGSATSAHWLATVDSGGLLLVWDLRSGYETHRFRGPESAKFSEYGLVAAPDGDWLAVSGGMGRIFWPAHGWRNEPIAQDEVTMVAAAGSGRLLTAGRAGMFTLRQASAGVQTVHSWNLDGEIAQLVTPPAGDWAAVVSRARPQVITVLDLPASEPVELSPVGAEIRCCRAAPNGRMLAAARADGVIMVWLRSRRLALTGIRLDGVIHDLSWTPDSRSLCVASSAGAQLLNLSAVSDVMAAERLRGDGSG